MSGIDVGDRRIRKGAGRRRSRRGCASRAARCRAQLEAVVDGISAQGGTPLVVADGPRVLGVIYLKDIVKPGMRERFDRDARAWASAP